MWPTENDYVKAVTRINPSPFALLNAKRITIIKDENDQPIKRSGNNSVIFKASMNGKFYALKCYTKEINNQAHYLSAVQKYIEAIQSRLFIPFELHESEVYVIKSENSYHGTYCVYLMPWVDGETLFDYVKTCCEESNTTALEEIFKEFQQIANWLLQQKFVHGDIAAENIMVTKDKKLVLVDYDNFLFEALKFTNGHSPFNADYQHPKRNPHVINLAADQFSILVLAISLRALQFKPELFFKYNNESGLIFTANTLREGDKSAVYKELKAIDDAYLQNLLHLLNISLHRQSIDVPLLETCIIDNDPSAYSRLLEIELEELKNELENASLRIQALQSEVSKELISKEKLFVENTRLKETLAKIEENKKKKEALKRSISLAMAGLTCVIIFAGIIFYRSQSKEKNAVAIKTQQETKSLPLIKDALPKKDTQTTAPIVSETQIAKAENDSPLIAQAKPDVPESITEKPELLTEKKNLATDKIFNHAIVQKDNSTVFASKYRKIKMEKAAANYNMFRETGF